MQSMKGKGGLAMDVVLTVGQVPGFESRVRSGFLLAGNLHFAFCGVGVHVERGR